MMTSTHPCDACGGRGSYYAAQLTSSRTVWTRCPVCLGAGQFPDRMPVADAVADAETLRPWIPYTHWLFTPAVANVIRYSRGSRGRAAEYAAFDAVAAARAAFRAVPGLRG